MTRYFSFFVLSVGFQCLGIEGFQPIQPRQQYIFNRLDPSQVEHVCPSQKSKIFAVNRNANSDRTRTRDSWMDAINRIRRVPQLFKNAVKRPMIVPIGISLLSTALTIVKPDMAQASAPVMALPKAEGRDPASEAIMEYERRLAAKTQQELNDMTIEARKIEAERGEAARIKFENDWKVRQQEIADERAAGLIELKRNLLDKGICPFTDIEGQRQTLLYSRGVDLGEVPGTQFYLEKEFERTAPKRSTAYKKAINRKAIACMVQDMKNRNIDPLDYFERHQDQTEAILDLPVDRAAALVKQYETNLEEYGQILPPKEDELSVKEKLAIKDPAAEKAEAKRLQAEAAAKAKMLKEEEKSQKAKIKAELKETMRAEKAKLKAEVKAAAEAVKEAAKKGKAESKEASEELKRVAAAAAASMVAASASAVSEVEATVESIAGLQDSVSTIVEKIDSTNELMDTQQRAVSTEIQSSDESKVTKTMTASEKQEIPDAVKGVAAVVLIGGSGISFKLYRDKVEKSEEERKRQLRLLMGGNKESSSTPYSALALEEIDVDVKPTDTGKTAVTSETPPTETMTTAPKKRRIGIKNVFGKKKNERETDLMTLVSSESDAPEFTKTLAKMLTFGAVGRFPSVVSLSGGRSIEKFDLDEAKKILIEAQTDADLSLEESAEIFANVVNCMLIDIVDLASTSLKEKDEKVTVDAINVVVDFMNHAASLYDSIAEGVTITPVTYGGDLSKSKLEQMYSSYAVSGMMNMDKMTDDFDNRVAMLQDVFQINEKKAEGLMMKAMQKNMMNMMKNGEGMEGMEEMLKGMGGLDGMPPGVGGMDGDGPSPEQLKEMLTALKDMKDSGSIPPAEFDKVKTQFNEAFGSSIDDVVKEASANNEELSQTDKDLLELMKSIMKD
jgi:hypothetical protein